MYFHKLLSLVSTKRPNETLGEGVPTGEGESASTGMDETPASSPGEVLDATATPSAPPAGQAGDPDEKSRPGGTKEEEYASEQGKAEREPEGAVESKGAKGAVEAKDRGEHREVAKPGKTSPAGKAAMLVGEVNPLKYFENPIRGNLLLRTPVGAQVEQTLQLFVKHNECNYATLLYPAIHGKEGAFARMIPQIFELLSTLTSNRVTVLFLGDLEEMFSDASAFGGSVRRALEAELTQYPFTRSRLLVVGTSAPTAALSPRLLDLFDVTLTVPVADNAARLQFLTAKLQDLGQYGLDLEPVVEQTRGWEFHALEKLVNFAQLQSLVENPENPRISAELLSRIVAEGLIPVAASAGPGGTQGQETGAGSTGGMSQSPPTPGEPSPDGIDANALDSSRYLPKDLVEQLYQEAADLAYTDLVQVLQKLIDGHPLAPEEAHLLGDHGFILKDKPRHALIQLNKAKKRVDELKKFFSKK